jgi:hypothetical protein
METAIGTTGRSSAEAISIAATAPHETRVGALAERIAHGTARWGLVTLLLAFGAYKFTTVEAEGIRPLVENSPFILDTRDDEIGCDDALEGTAALAEFEARHGERLHDAAVSRHLDDCPECAEEYASLLAALIEGAA